MFVRKWLSILFIVTAWVAWTVVPAVAEPVQSAGEAEPIKIYLRVWQLISNTFYDPTCNHQDWGRWQHRYDGKLATAEDAYRAINTMLASLGDRYTRFLTPEAFKQETEQISARLYGIGIQMGYDKNLKVIVVAPIPDTPAAQAGLRSLDEIVAVDSKDVHGLAIEAVSKMIRGAIGTPVSVTVERNKQRITFKILRGEIPIRSVQKAEMINADIGYVRLTTFISSAAAEEMKEALSQLLPARGIILDLRDNPGGLVTNAIDICNIFLSGSFIVYTVDRDGHKVSTVSTAKPFCRQPLVVLINHGSASASEITSGALQDDKRAELVGQKSFGKALVQAINKLDDGSSVHITVARYLTPSGCDINKKGIAPDWEVNLTTEDYKAGRGPWWLDPGGPAVARRPGDLKDIQLKKAVVVLEEKLQNAEAPYQLKLNFPGFGPTPGVGIQGGY